MTLNDNSHQIIGKGKKLSSLSIISEAMQAVGNGWPTG